MEAQGANFMKRMILTIILLWSVEAVANELSYKSSNDKEEQLQVCIDTARDGVILETRIIENKLVTLQMSMTAKRYCTLIKAFEQKTEDNHYSCFCSNISKN